jgi:hypothetical protein
MKETSPAIPKKLTLSNREYSTIETLRYHANISLLTDESKQTVHSLPYS